MTPFYPSAWRLLGVAAQLVMLLVPASAVASQDDDDIDVFMQKVLERRVTNWEDLFQYTLREREVIEIVDPDGGVLEGQVGEYTWYVRDGYLVRSPDTMNGAKVTEAEREESEQRFLERARQSRDEESESPSEHKDDGGTAGAERAYFLGLPYEPGNYYLAGFEEFSGMEVARIEYYPQELFDNDEPSADADVGRDEADRWTRQFQNASRITLWVLAEEHQIVRVAYDNIGLDFLPYRWLMQVEDVTGELVMHQPFPEEDVWLPRDITITAQVGIAIGTYQLTYTVDYFDYAESEVGAEVQFRLPGIRRRNE